MNKSNVMPRSGAATFDFGRTTLVEMALAPVTAAADLLITWQKRIRQRDALLRMTPRQLEDIGLAPSDVHGEARKPFWMA